MAVFTPVGSPTAVLSVTTATFTLTPAGGHADGTEFVLLGVCSESATIFCNSVSSSNATWSQLGTGYENNTRYFTTWIGVVTSLTPQTVTLGFSGATPTIRAAYREFSSKYFAWLIQNDPNSPAGYQNAGSTAWPSITASELNGELYFGTEFNFGSPTAGTTPGFVYTTTGSGNGVAWDLNCGSGAITPVWGNSTSKVAQAVLVYMPVVGGASLTVAVPGAAVPGFYPGVPPASAGGGANVSGVQAAVAVAGVAGAASGGAAVAGQPAAVVVAGIAGTAAGGGAVAGQPAAVVVAGKAGTAAGTGNVAGAAAPVVVAGVAGTAAGGGSVSGAVAAVVVAGVAGTPAGTSGGSGNVSGVQAAVVVAALAGTAAGSAAVTGQPAIVTVLGVAGTPAAGAAVAGQPAAIVVAGVAGTAAAGGTRTNAVSAPTVADTRGHSPVVTQKTAAAAAVTERALTTPAVTAGRMSSSQVSQKAAAVPTVSGG